MLATVVVSVLMTMVSTYAQGPIDRWRHTTPLQIRDGSRSQASSRILFPVDTIGFGIPLDTRRLAVNNQQLPPAARERSTRRKVLGGIVGGVGGFFGGLFLGAAIEGDRCDCDDPGLVGALIGAPVGAAAGGILGYKFLF